MLVWSAVRMPMAACACRDDISDHDRWAKHFGAPRVMHSAEIRPLIRDIEVQLQGTGPWDLQGNAIGEGELDGGVQLVHTPGHTRGSICLWHAATKAMFTGDHFGYSLRVGRPTIFPRYNRAGYEVQVESVRKLLNFDFEHVLPGHGRRFHVRGAEERLQVVNDTADAELAGAR
jgi:glyoxylase-like metal-dependent hydrolase (beta-lactamase superfamily II)